MCLCGSDDKSFSCAYNVRKYLVVGCRTVFSFTLMVIGKYQRLLLTLSVRKPMQTHANRKRTCKPRQRATQYFHN